MHRKNCYPSDFTMSEILSPQMDTNLWLIHTSKSQVVNVQHSLFSITGRKLEIMCHTLAINSAMLERYPLFLAIRGTYAQQSPFPLTPLPQRNRVTTYYIIYTDNPSSVYTMLKGLS